MRRPLVLVVDDEADIRETLTNYLRRALEGVGVVAVENARDAEKLLRLGHVDLILSDHCMPGENGAQLLGRVRAINPRTVRLLMTAFPEQGVLMEACNEAQVQHIFTKPLDPPDVAQRLARFLEESGAYSRPAASVMRPTFRALS